ncbi:membrane-bound dehydrogenase domain-containing protein [Catenovulum agarivorans DS-2]|uniref:Membrane-bound dehydrogenase domain-containing protein n=1 Tax=Catenovulum agarivorans DS-2 TaxID=1328313 RepID=W7QIR5_9ALTE|nr:PVC-type heme-binding CxxCH protein [Catenovulum agarivorans]EWH11741.1 membrane-bound dehydrogenase domain-containing protein [Catenovulum agarivorans DS-2]
MKKSFIQAAVISQLFMSMHSISAEADKKITFKGDRAGHVMEDIIPAEHIPPSPILTVEQALKSFQLQPGFVLENVVSEPNIFNPVALAFDGNGRIFVCKMTRFMQDLTGSTEHMPDGSIAVLEDTNGDGKVDKRTELLTDIEMPRTIAMVEGGLFYADNQQLYFVELDEEGGEIVVKNRQVADATYAEGGNVEHKTNTMLYGIDNWYYNAKSAKKYQVLAHNAPVPRGSKEIYRNQYWKLIKGQSDYRGQWGLTMDDQGRLYHNGNSQPLQGEYLLPGSLRHNPGYWPKMGAHSIGTNNIYPARMNPGVNRGYVHGLLHTDEKNYGKLKQFTAASGSLIYRGDNFPKKYYGMGLTPEPAGNLISARFIEEKVGELAGTAIFPQQEILTSTDERFRPVNLYTAPDGSLYIVDMYHGIIQHKEFLTSYLGNQIKQRDLDKGNHTMGRIYRLRWANAPAGKQPNLTNKSSLQLVEFLSHANGWWRDTARQMIVQHALIATNQADTQAAINRIKQQLSSTNNEVASINLLWTLYGLDAVDLASVNSVLNSAKLPASSKKAAIAVAAKLPKPAHQTFVDKAIELSKNNYDFALQSAVTAAALQSDNVLILLKQILDQYLPQPYIRQAVASGLNTRAAEFLAMHNGEYPDSEFMYIMNNLGKKPAEINNRAQLSELGIQLYDQGKELFMGRGGCAGCHGPDGDGISGLGPTFWKSEWVIESEEKLAKVLLHGLQGPIKIGWMTWRTSAIMPGYATRPDISDQDLAAIATYIRNTWANTADTDGEVSPEVIKKVREATQGQNQPYTMKDFQ